jgi:release factor glutamine methyltransferase
MQPKVLELVARAAPYLAQHGSSSPRLDSEVLLAEVLGCSRMDLYLQFERPLLAPEVDRYRELCRRRAGGEPMAYILGRKEFMGLDFEVGPAVLVPRPETELLVETALRSLSALGRGEPRILDVGTGSGAIAVSVLAACPEATAVATDVSEEALEVAARNGTRHGVTDRLQLVRADLVDGVEGPFDLVLANLPYIDPEWPDAVTPEVAASEPAVALFAGRDGLDHQRRLVPLLSGLVRRPGAALLELDPRQAASLLALADGVASTSVLKDLAGHDRLLVLDFQTGAGPG